MRVVIDCNVIISAGLNSDAKVFIGEEKLTDKQLAHGFDVRQRICVI